MPSVNQVLRERRAVWRALKRQLKAADSSLERLERFQNRVLARKRKGPELEDLDVAIKEATILTGEIARYAKLLAAGYPA